MIEEIKDSAAFLSQRGVKNPKIGVVLGTGLGNFTTKVNIDAELSYDQIPGFPEATVEFHKGRLLFGTIRGVSVMVMQGRYHFYEGYTQEQIAFPVRVMKMLGVETLLISNAAGCMNLNWNKGDLMLISDHINILPGNPLIGPNHVELGIRFPDMSEAYSRDLRDKVKRIAANKNIRLQEGVYAVAQGPMLETPAEYRYLKRIGGDVVGMSTVPEVIAAKHAGMKVVAISVLTDECDPDDLKAINIDEIIEIAGKSEKVLTELFEELIKDIGNE